MAAVIVALIVVGALVVVGVVGLVWSARRRRREAVVTPAPRFTVAGAEDVPASGEATDEAQGEEAIEAGVESTAEAAPADEVGPEGEAGEALPGEDVIRDEPAPAPRHVSGAVPRVLAATLSRPLSQRLAAATQDPPAPDELVIRFERSDPEHAVEPVVEALEQLGYQLRWKRRDELTFGAPGSKVARLVVETSGPDTELGLEVDGTDVVEAAAHVIDDLRAEGHAFVPRRGAIELAAGRRSRVIITRRPGSPLPR